MIATESFAAVMDLFESDTDAAAREVFVKFAGRLVALTRGQFEKRLAHRVDPEEVVQSAFKSFFVRQRAGGYQLHGWPGVWGLLTVITLRKCADRVAHLQAARRDVRREVYDPAAADRPDTGLNRDPSPEEAAVLAETVERLFRVVDAGDRPVLELSLQGHSAAEISLRLGRALRTVHRIRERVQAHLRRLQEG
jgi:RNA polymerase sigma-70 factor (ECF subfamily)